MHFTILGNDFTLTANFVPCLVWSIPAEHEHQEHMWNQHRDRPSYEVGDLQQAMEHFKLGTEKKRTAMLVVHGGGNQKAEKEDFERIKQDCQEIFNDLEVVSPWETSAV